ncbi:hypothetical protein SAMN05216215_105034 [Saccharopolyspora shandongensis]|uniref:V/A-type H+-transporting ATPase subunit E n=1 Tax=Saccharopolyspora shandongensis TaxID=418495 RepID=A0A1H3QX52_9PSEU|nr:hypothetical protein [Saccharopolyspora shandongensis]SDZ17946.1 hypothetical protein SAMN05216215_105034 [Saccharopolyspora shandongensis]
MSSSVRAALAPLREALVTRAGREAERDLHAARQEAGELIAKAQVTAQTILDDAAARGRTDADAVLAAERTRGRRAARTVELVARREAFEELTNEVVASLARRDDPALRDRLVSRARRVLGNDAQVCDAPGGGVIGEAPGQLLDLSFHTAAVRAVEELGADVEGLWVP